MTGPEVNDHFYASWGYDQTNVDFWKVVGLTPSGKSVRVQKVSTIALNDQGAAGAKAVPGEVSKGCWVDDPDGGSVYDPEAMPPVETKRLRSWTSNGTQRWAFCWKSYADAYLWDGTPKYQTGYGYGH